MLVFPTKERKLKEEKKDLKEEGKVGGGKKRKKRKNKIKREKGAAAWQPLAAHARTPGRPTGPYAAHAHVHMGFSHVGPALKGAQLGPCAASKRGARAGSSVLADRTTESADPTSSTSACRRPHQTVQKRSRCSSRLVPRCHFHAAVFLALCTSQ